MGIRIDELPPAPSAEADYQIPAMRGGATGKLAVQQLATFIIAIVTDSAPATLDTLNELAAALGDDPNFATTVMSALAGKQPLDGMLTALAALTSANGKFLAFSGADAPVLRDIVGTVSQSGGVPTGAIIERGSNADGSYVRLADGTQICRFTGLSQACNVASGPIFTSTEATWTYPATFAAIPEVTASSSTNSRWAAVTPGPTSALVRQYQTATSATATGVSLIAIGRWF